MNSNDQRRAPGMEGRGVNFGQCLSSSRRRIWNPGLDDFAGKAKGDLLEITQLGGVNPIGNNAITSGLCNGGATKRQQMQEKSSTFVNNSSPTPPHKLRRMLVGPASDENGDPLLVPRSPPTPASSSSTTTHSQELALTHVETLPSCGQSFVKGLPAMGKHVGQQLQQEQQLMVLAAMWGWAQRVSSSPLAMASLLHAQQQQRFHQVQQYLFRLNGADPLKFQDHPPNGVQLSLGQQQQIDSTNRSFPSPRSRKQLQAPCRGRENKGSVKQQHQFANNQLPIAVHGFGGNECFAPSLSHSHPTHINDATHRSEHGGPIPRTQIRINAGEKLACSSSALSSSSTTLESEAVNLTRVHKNHPTTIPLTMASPAINVNTCAICSSSFRLTSELVQHMRNNHRTTKYKRRSNGVILASAEMNTVAR